MMCTGSRGGDEGLQDGIVMTLPDHPQEKGFQDIDMEDIVMTLPDPQEEGQSIATTNKNTKKRHMLTLPATFLLIMGSVVGLLIPGMMGSRTLMRSNFRRDLLGSSQVKGTEASGSDLANAVVESTSLFPAALDAKAGSRQLNKRLLVERVRSLKADSSKPNNASEASTGSTGTLGSTKSSTKTSKSTRRSKSSTSKSTKTTTAPSLVPSPVPTEDPSDAPSNALTQSPTVSPRTFQPTIQSTNSPTPRETTKDPTRPPTPVPSDVPSPAPSVSCGLKSATIDRSLIDRICAESGQLNFRVTHHY